MKILLSSVAVFAVLAATSAEARPFTDPRAERSDAIDNANASDLPPPRSSGGANSR